ncbi:MAG: Carbamoyltransferase [Acidobacteria bacterium]|nr:Carbamoyltransferase [Acidobacteriota bacterium]
MVGKFILAIHAGHNASVCVGDSSGLIYAIQEERLNGEKNYWGFPKQAIQACLNYVGASARDLEVIVHGADAVFCRYHARDDILKSYRRQETVAGLLRQRLAMPLIIGLRRNYGRDTLKTLLAAEGLGEVPLAFYDHHLTHGATAYYGLRRNALDRYLVLTCDGSGDLACASVRIMGGSGMEEVAVTPWENSLGALYSWVTYLSGFVPMEHEYKLMGMAPYASERAAAETADIFHAYLGLDDRGLSLRRKTLRRTNDIHARLVADLKNKRFDHICAGLQRFTEDILATWTANAVKATGIGKILAGGGVFMNVKANKRIAELPEVKSFEAFPSCGDETLPIGAYYLEATKRFGDRAPLPPLKDFYLGDDLDEKETLAALQKSGYSYERPNDLAETIAGLLADGHPVARCAGRMEFGARALGNRSILADPKDLDVVRVINRMVKKRDFWMPFAPMMMAHRQHDYLQNPKKLPSPYMMMTFDTKENFRDLIAAVHNADLTCRAQILTEEQNPEMAAILKAFDRQTGRGVILNTSFNLHGFPICRNAADALYVFRESGLQYLNLGTFIVRKSYATRLS